ncbi:MAG TPA: thiamine pyrophosphate-binding protein [bacterium]|nr:thiamine pyrophosphate-binding protein [bacterium]
MTVRGAHLALRCLKLEGVRKLFTIVGDTILPLCDAAVDEGLELVDTRHEAAALHMADAWTRVTGEPAVALVTGGPGFANAISALPPISASESPVILLAGCGELAERGMYSFQEIDQVGLAAPATKGSWMVLDRRRIPDMIATAFRTALDGRRGPVHLTIPIDIQEQRGTDGETPAYSPREYRHAGRTLGDPALVAQAVAVLSSAERPVAIAANAARHTVAPRSLQDFVEAMNLPCFTVEQARGLLSDDHPLCFGYADPALNDAAKHFRDADAVLLLGKRLDHRYRYGMPPFFNAAAKLIQVDPASAEIGRNRGVHVGIAGDPGAVVEQMTAAARAGTWSNITAWRQQLENTRDAQRRRFESLGTDEAPLHAMRVLREVDTFTNDGTVVVVDGGDFAGWGRSYLKARNPGGWLRLGPLGQLGCGIPYAIAAKLARPQSDVLLLIGDGSFGFYGIEYDTAVRHGAAFTAVMGNDALWGIDRNFQLAYYGRAVGTELRAVRYDRMVESLGGYGEHVEEAAGIAPAIRRARESGKASLVSVAIRNTPCPLADAMIARRGGAHASGGQGG